MEDKLDVIGSFVRATLKEEVQKDPALQQVADYVVALESFFALTMSKYEKVCLDLATATADCETLKRRLFEIEKER